MSGRRPTAIDLFAGVGGLSLGFEQAGFDVLAAFDSDPIHVSSYARNFPRTSVHAADLSTSSADELGHLMGLPGNVDVVFGGPPCQGFSLIGKREVDDPRNHLIYHFGRLVVQLRPRYFVLENVPGLLSTTARGVLARFIQLMRKSDYRIVAPVQVLDAADYLVPQRRRRAFILGYRKGELPPSYPLREKPCPISNLSVWAAIGDLPGVDLREDFTFTDECERNGATPSSYVRLLDSRLSTLPSTQLLSGCRRSIHRPSTVARFSATQVGTSEPISRFFRLDPDGLAPSLRAGTASDRGSFSAPRPIHPVQPRCITVREGARLHSFPDTFQFHPTIWHGFRQIGNSVPPLLALAVARSLLQSLQGLSRG